MEFTNHFEIPLGIQEAFEVLTDLERIAPCMPGASLEEHDGERYRGRVKISLGPMNLVYLGTASVQDIDPETYTARISANGRENRGAGTASADVRAKLHETDGMTEVEVITSIDISGKPAQFGRGLLADIGTSLIDKFSDNLREMLSREHHPETTPDELQQRTGPQAPSTRAGSDNGESFDLIRAIGLSTWRNVALVSGLTVALGIALLWILFLR